MINFAFFGTGPCDPYKDIKQFGIFIAVLLCWAILISVIRGINSSDKPQATKSILSVTIVVVGLAGTAVIAFMSYALLACSA